MKLAKGHTVAIVDDDIRVLESIEDLMDSAGYSVRPFASAEALLEENVLPHLDCLIADIGLPGISGLELHRQARAIAPDLPIIFITARQNPADQRRAIAQGHQGFFRKPFDPAALLVAVTRALESSPQRES
jgi:FixJ family two-component response regulator